MKSQRCACHPFGYEGVCLPSFAYGDVPLMPFTLNTVALPHPELAALRYFLSVDGAFLLDSCHSLV